MAHSSIENLFFSASTDPQILKALEKSPYDSFRNIGVYIPEHYQSEFDEFFKTSILPAIKDPSTLGAGPSAGCAACNVAAFTIAAGIVAVGVAGLSTLTAASSIVISLASFAGVSTATALAFIVTLGTTLAGGVTQVATAICAWTGAC